MLANGNLPLILGAWNSGLTRPATGLSRFYTGILDEIRIYNRPLSAIEISQLYAGPTSQPTSRPSTQPTSDPTSQPTKKPSFRPTSGPTSQPTKKPSFRPTSGPTSQPTKKPSFRPISDPTSQPTGRPSFRPTSGPTSQPTGRPSFRPTSGPTSQPTGRPSFRPTSGPTSQPTGRPSFRPTSGPTSQPTSRPSFRPTSGPTSQPTKKPSFRPTSGPTSQPTGRPSFRPTSGPTSQPTKKPSFRPTSGPTSQPTGSPSFRPTSGPTSQPTGRPSFRPTSGPTSQPTGRPSFRPTSGPTSQPTGRPSFRPISGPTSQPTGRPSFRPTSGPTSQPTGSPSFRPTSGPTSQPTKKPSFRPISGPTSQPTGRPSFRPTSGPTSQPTGSPSFRPTSGPTSQPTKKPSFRPISGPTSQPTGRPSFRPISGPTSQPTGRPSFRPTSGPTSQPTGRPSFRPTSGPTSQPTGRPSFRPTSGPTSQPTKKPSFRPTSGPTSQPTGRPSFRPTSDPTSQPTSRPSFRPTSGPTGQPTKKPSFRPTSGPTSQPTSRPSFRPTSGPSIYPTSRPSFQPTIRPSRYPTSRPSIRPTPRPSRYPSSRPSFKPIAWPSLRPTRRPTSSPSVQPSSQPSAKPSLSPSHAFQSNSTIRFLHANTIQIETGALQKLVTLPMDANATVSCGVNVQYAYSGCFQVNDLGQIRMPYQFYSVAIRDMAIAPNALQFSASLLDSTSDSVIVSRNASTGQSIWGYKIPATDMTSIVYDSTTKITLAAGQNALNHSVVVLVNDAGQIIFSNVYQPVRNFNIKTNINSAHFTHLNDQTNIVLYGKSKISGFGTATSQLTFDLQGTMLGFSLFYFSQAAVQLNTPSASTVDQNNAQIFVAGAVKYDTEPFRGAYLTAQFRALLNQFVWQKKLSSNIGQVYISDMIIEKNLYVLGGVGQQYLFFMQLDSKTGHVINGFTIKPGYAVQCGKISKLQNYFSLACQVQNKTMYFAVSPQNLSISRPPYGYTVSQNIHDVLGLDQNNIQIITSIQSFFSPLRGLPSPINLIEPFQIPVLFEWPFRNQEWVMPTSEPTHSPQMPFRSDSPSEQPSNYPTLASKNATSLSPVIQPENQSFPSLQPSGAPLKMKPPTPIPVLMTALPTFQQRIPTITPIKITGAPTRHTVLSSFPTLRTTTKATSTTRAPTLFGNSPTIFSTLVPNQIPSAAPMTRSSIFDKEVKGTIEAVVIVVLITIAACNHKKIYNWFKDSILVLFSVEGIQNRAAEPISEGNSEKNSSYYELSQNESEDEKESSNDENRNIGHVVSAEDAPQAYSELSSISYPFSQRLSEDETINDFENDCSESEDGQAFNLMWAFHVTRSSSPIFFQSSPFLEQKVKSDDDYVISESLSSDDMQIR